MAALTRERDTKRRGHRARLMDFDLDAAAATRLWQGSMAAKDTDGNAVPASADADLIVVGRSEFTIDNLAGAAGDKKVRISRGVHNWANSAGADEITKANLFADCYAVDDQTVALTDGTGARPRAGRIVDVDEHGVWVEHL